MSRGLQSYNSIVIPIYLFVTLVSSTLLCIITPVLSYKLYNIIHRCFTLKLYSCFHSGEVSSFKLLTYSNNFRCHLLLWQLRKTVYKQEFLLRPHKVPLWSRKEVGVQYAWLQVQNCQENGLETPPKGAWSKLFKRVSEIVITQTKWEMQ